MKPHTKKAIAPLVVTAVMILYYAAYFGCLFTVLEGVWRWLFGLVPLAFVAVTVYVCIERIREIQKGEEDDLSQY